MFDALSSAGNATLIANGGSNGGFGGAIDIAGDGGTARVKVFGNGSLYTGGHGNALFAIGSLEGNGDVFLGHLNTGVGNNNASTVFSGVVHDGQPHGPPPDSDYGSLTKVGSGTLILQGANLHKGGTIVNAGKLMINNVSGSGTGSGPVTVNGPAGILGGTGTISGPTTINGGSVLSGGDTMTATGSLKVANSLLLNSGAVMEVGLGPSHTHSTLTRTGGNWNFAAAQGFSIVDVAAAPGLYDNVITGLIGDPGGTASWTITTPKFAGTFTYDGAGNIDLNITGVPSVPAEITRSGNDITITFRATQGRTYHLERKGMVSETSWQSIPGVDDLTAAGDGIMQMTDPNAIAGGQAFYRVNLLP